MPFKLTTRKIRRSLLVLAFAFALLFQFGVHLSPATTSQTHSATIQVVADGDDPCTGPACGH